MTEHERAQVAALQLLVVSLCDAFIARGMGALVADAERVALTAALKLMARPDTAAQVGGDRVAQATAGLLDLLQWPADLATRRQAFLRANGLAHRD